MSQQQHERAVSRALRANDRTGAAFARLGTSAHPRGAILSAYRSARREIAGQFGASAIIAATYRLRGEVEQTARRELSAAIEQAAERAARDLGIYGLQIATNQLPDTTPAVTAILGVYDAQARAAQAALGLPDGQTLILGDGARAGLLTSGPVTTETAKWIASLSAAAYGAIVDTATRQAGDADQYWKQAVAAIDQLTTDCCLRVTGQVQPIDKPFHLTGTPRYADYMDWPGFHWWCRTATALVSVDDIEDGLTKQIRGAGRAELRARKQTGKRVAIWPSHGRSRRK